MNTAEPMDAKDLLSVTPEALVQAILKRREEAAKQLPDELAKRVDENDRAYAVFHEAKQRLEMMKNDGSSAEELEKATLDLEEKETFRRRTVSRLQIVKNAMNDIEEGQEFWSTMEEGNWGHLLEDAERVNQGGVSSYVLKAEQQTEVSQ